MSRPDDDGGARPVREDIRVPDLGSDTSHARIGRWWKKPGDSVTVEDRLVEIETKDVTLEVSAPTSGRVIEIIARDGQKVRAGQLLGRIDVYRGSSRREAAATGPREAVDPGQDIWTAEELRAVVGLVLEEMGASSLTTPDVHLDYVRTRIRAAVARHVV